MAAQGAYIVVDIGKTMSKVTLWSRGGELLDRKVRTNAVHTLDGLRRLDMQGIGDWLVEALASHSGQPVEAIVPVAHGAAVVALRDDAACIAPLDYEEAIPPEVLKDYRQKRPPFTETGSPALPGGLNLGAQLYLLDQLHPQELREATLVPWPQYWAWFMSGRTASEITSLGCHTDLWKPAGGGFSDLAVRMGWNRRFAPIARASEAVGTLRADLAEKTGLPSDTRIMTGIHDSNAALLAARGYAEVAENEATVLSTGTWFIAMRHAGEPVDLAALPEARDCLVNVDAYGTAIPSARFMGGREIEALIESDENRIDIRTDQPALLGALPAVLEAGAMAMPSLAPGTGPFPGAEHRWIARPADRMERRAAASLYAALLADTALGLIGAKDRLLIEGRFAAAEVFVRALASLLPDTSVYTTDTDADASFGALRLIDPSLSPKSKPRKVEPLEFEISAYRDEWHRLLEKTT